MNARPTFDETLGAMLARRAGQGAPPDLAAAIEASVAATPQKPQRWWTRWQPSPSATPAVRLAWNLAVIGLLAATAISAALVGGALLRLANEPVVVPQPSATAAPEATPSASPAVPPAVTSSAYGPITWHMLDVDGSDAWWRTLTGTPYGPIAVSEADLRWPAPDGSWDRLTLPFEPEGLFPVGNDVILGGSQPFWLLRSGTSWVLGEPVDLDGAMDVNDAAVGPRGILLTDGTAVQVSTDGRTFVRATQPPARAKLQANATECEPLGASGSGAGEGHMGPMIVTDRGFVALTPADPSDWNDDPVCEPVAWFSADGSEWKLSSPTSPFGPGASVREVASSGGRLVAIGETTDGAGNPLGSAIWFSDDGAASWERLPTPEPAGPCSLPEPLLCLHLLARVAAGEAGWVMLDWEGFAWTSPDGRTWEAVRGSLGVGGGYVPQGLALSPGSIVVTSPGAPEAVVGTFEP